MKHDKPKAKQPKIKCCNKNNERKKSEAKLFAKKNKKPKRMTTKLPSFKLC